MGGFSLMNMQNYFNLINNSTFVENINKGITQTNDYFGTKTIQGMALNNLPIWDDEIRELGFNSSTYWDDLAKTLIKVITN